MRDFSGYPYTFMRDFLLFVIKPRQQSVTLFIVFSLPDYRRFLPLIVKKLLSCTSSLFSKFITHKKKFFIFIATFTTHKVNSLIINK